MRKIAGFSVLVILAICCTNMAQPTAGDARAVINKAIKAAGGEANLKKHQAATWTEKGTYYGMGEGQPYTGKLAAHYPDQFRMQILAGDMELFTIVLNKNKGWIKTGKDTRELDADELKHQQHDARAGWITSLLPLKDEAFALTTIDGVQVDKKPTAGVQVTRKDYPKVKLYFDKQSGLLVKSEFKSFAAEEKKIMVSETYYQNYKDVDGSQMPTRIVIKRRAKENPKEPGEKEESKLFVETELQDLKPAMKLDVKLFAAP